MAQPKDEKVQPKPQAEPRKDYVLKEKPEDFDETFEDSLAIDFGTPEEEQGTANKIADEIAAILTDRKDLEDEWQSQDDAYEGALPDKTFPFEGCSNVNVPIISEKVDAVSSRLERGVWEVEPLWIVRPLKGAKMESCRKKEQLLDYTARREMNLEQELDNVFHDATNKGTGILEIPWLEDTERVTDVEHYDGTKKGLAKFLENYPEPPEDKKGIQLYNRYLKKLEDKEDVEFLVECDDPVWNGPNPKHVPLKDFITNDVKELRRAHICGKRIWLTGDELLKKYDEEYVNRIRYNYDEETSERLEEIEGFLTEEFEIFILIYKYDYNDDGLEERCLIDLAYDKKVILKARKYPYWHKRPYFIPFYISSRATGFYRDGIAKMLEDIQVLSNVIVNLTVDAATVGVVPSFKAREGAKSYLAPQLTKGFYPGVTYWLQDIANDLNQIDIRVPNLGIMQTLAAMSEKYAELRSGVSHYMTGKESPLDPSAPARKAMILLQEANMRVGKYISNIQKSMSEVAYHIIKLYYQFMPEGKEYELIGKEGEPAFPKITREELRERAIYIPHGSIAVFMRSLEKEINREVYETLRQEPIIASNPNAVRVLIEVFLRSAGADWDKRIHELVPSEEELKEKLIEIQKEAIKRLREEEATKGQRLQELVNEGVPEQKAIQQVEEEFAKQKEEQAKKEKKGASVG